MLIFLTLSTDKLRRDTLGIRILSKYSVEQQKVNLLRSLSMKCIGWSGTTDKYDLNKYLIYILLIQKIIFILGVDLFLGSWPSVFLIGLNLI